MNIFLLKHAHGLHTAYYAITVCASARNTEPQARSERSEEFTVSRINNHHYPPDAHAGDTFIDPRTFVLWCRYETREPYRWGGGLVYTSRYSRVLAWDELLRLLSAPACPYACVATGEKSIVPSMSVPKLVMLPIEHRLWADTQLYFDYLDDHMTEESTPSRRRGSSEASSDASPTERRLRANDTAISALQMKKAADLAKLTESQVTRIRTGLDESMRMTYVEIKSELLRLVADNKLEDLTPLELERLVLMRMAELEGLLRMVNSPEDFLTSREAAAYGNLMRQIGDAAQKQTDSHKVSRTQKKSAFDALQDLAQRGFKVTVEGADVPEIIDAEFTSDYSDLLD